MLAPDRLQTLHTQVAPASSSAAASPFSFFLFSLCPHPRPRQTADRNLEGRAEQNSSRENPPPSEGALLSPAHLTSGQGPINCSLMKWLISPIWFRSGCPPRPQVLVGEPWEVTGSRSSQLTALRRWGLVGRGGYWGAAWKAASLIFPFSLLPDLHAVSSSPRPRPCAMHAVPS